MKTIRTTKDCYRPLVIIRKMLSIQGNSVVMKLETTV